MKPRFWKIITFPLIDRSSFVFGFIFVPKSLMDQSRIIRELSSLHPNRTGEDRTWRKNDYSQNPRRMIEDRSHRKAQQRALWGLLSIVVILLILVILVAFLMYDPVVSSRVCVPGFTGSNCEKSDFIGTFLWSMNEYYTLDDGLQHRNGIAFRVFAPGARNVSVFVKPETGIESTYSMMYFEVVRVDLIGNSLEVTGSSM